MREVARLWGCLALAVASGCVPPVLADEPPPEESFPEKAANILCASESCCRAWFHSFDADACRRHVRGEMETAMSAAIGKGGRVVRAEADALLEALRIANGECVYTEALAADMDVATERMFTGWKAPGEACVHDEECSDPADGWAKCVEQPLLGDDCRGSAQCRAVRRAGVDADRCLVSASGGGPTGDECVAEPILDVVRCETSPGLYCDGKSNRCNEPAGEGTPCLHNEDCFAGLYCDGAESRTCLAAPGPGEACPYFGRCSKGAVCTSTGRCVLPNADGAPCTAADECALGSSCNRGICLPLRLIVTPEGCGLP
jgi:hypothetical protein